MPATMMMPTPTVMMASPSEPPAFEADATPPAAATIRPSKDDQAALDALLNAPATPASAAPAGRRPARADSWSPQSSRPPVRRTARGPSAMILGGATLLLVAAAVGAAWYLWGRTPASAGTKVAARPPVTSMPPGSVSTMPATPRPLASTAAPATTTLPVVFTVATDPVRSGLVSNLHRPGGNLTGTSGFQVEMEPKRLPHAAAPRNPPASLAEARALLKGGELEQAAQGFAATVKAAPANAASVQILVACSPETVQKAVANAGSPELFIVPVNYKGRDCYRLCWGLYESAAKAASQMRSLPEYFRKGATPRVVGASEIVR